jgi:AcrR family transcriptional regulator
LTTKEAGTLLAAFHQRRKQNSRERLIAAALEQFCERGYLRVSVEDIASSAGVSRMTFYRHFSGKAALAGELFKETSSEGLPRYTLIGDMDYRSRKVVAQWVTTLFAADRANRRILRVFTQATADEDGFTEQAQSFIGDLIKALGRSIEAFAIDPHLPEHRRRWLTAWLLLYELLDQSNHAAMESGVATDPLVIDILAERFVSFVEQHAEHVR